MDADGAAAEKVRALGFTTVPVTAVGDRAVQGFNAGALRDLLGLSADPADSLSPEGLLAKYRLVFGAAQRVILQIPDDRLDWVTPGRERTLRQLTWHIFDRAEDFVKVAHGGEFTAGMINDYMRRASAARTAGDIAAYGGRVLTQVEDLITRRRDALDQTVNTYFGATTVFDLMGRALSMAAFRLRGTYRYVQMLGIEPEAPLGPDDFVGIAVPSGTP